MEPCAVPEFSASPVPESSFSVLFNLYNLIARISLSKFLLRNYIFLLYLLVALLITYKLLIEL